MVKEDLRLVKTCGACPEQYDVVDKEDKIVAYFRLRHGEFTVECPDCGGTLVYKVYTDGDGMFEEYERAKHIDNALNEVLKFYNKE